MIKSIFKKDKKYTFSDYFELNNPTEEIVAEFGYLLSTEIIQLPMDNSVDKQIIKKLQETYYDILPKITLNSAKRDFLIAPLLLEMIRHCDAKINVEYPIEIDDKLGGFLDYLIRSSQELIVIEAKKGDLDKGFNQLAVELIALDQYESENSPELLYGAVTIGEIWRFGVLKRKDKVIVKDIHSQRIPEDTGKVFSILLGILKRE
ncbi:hypothetical protein PN36_21025 [Candidatus Thiomargarita nelsonii]|uniref:Type I restriction enzyme R protein N-terminal domain-containing protein n=1 Tax=Candidatus Thiomargarita nelsonii TaxID=1003181 RepID=A0A0A6PA57_9GAMM|nr:hypothetical protein PN36_21025 [Candidatus Thiomargarita nelsonii]